MAGTADAARAGEGWPPVLGTGVAPGLVAESGWAES